MGFHSRNEQSLLRNHDLTMRIYCKLYTTPAVWPTERRHRVSGRKTLGEACGSHPGKSKASSSTSPSRLRRSTQPKEARRVLTRGRLVGPGTGLLRGAHAPNRKSSHRTGTVKPLDGRFLERFATQIQEFSVHLARGCHKRSGVSSHWHRHGSVRGPGRRRDIPAIDSGQYLVKLVLD